jgi:hypothetical protein
VQSKQLVDGLVQGRLLQYDGLQKLCLASCSLQCDEAVVLGRALEGIGERARRALGSKVVQVRASDQPATRAGLACSLVVLDLRNNRISDKGALALANMLAGDDPSASVPLHALQLDGNQVHLRPPAPLPTSHPPPVAANLSCLVQAVCKRYSACNQRPCRHFTSTTLQALWTLPGL